MSPRKNDVINLTDDDYKRKSFKTAPSGTYFMKIGKKSKIKANRAGDGNVANLVATITKGEHKGVNVFENIAPHVAWKIGQLLAALGIKKKKLTLQELIKLVKDKELRAILRVRMFEGKKRNEVVQWLPLKPGKDEDDAEDTDDEDDDEDEDEDTDTDSDDSDDDDESEDEDDEDDDDDSDESDDDEDDDEDSDDEDDDSDDDSEDDSDDDDEDDDDEDEEDEEEDEEEDVKPKPRRGAAKKAPPAAAKKTSRKKK